MTYNPSQSFTLPQELFGSLVEDMAPSDLPIGASPRNNDVFFLPGGVFTRPALKGLFASTGAGAILSLSDFRLASGDWKIITLDNQGNLYATDSLTGSRTFLFQLTAEGRQHYASYGNFLFIASSAVGPNPNPWATKQSGFDVPAYWNGTDVKRVTTDAPPPPTVVTLLVPPATVQANNTTASLSITAYETSGAQQGQNLNGQTYTYYTQITYTCTTAPSATLVGQVISITGLTGASAAQANVQSAYIVAVSGNTFTLSLLSQNFFSATGQSGTGVTGGGGTGLYAVRSGNYVKVYLGSSLPANFIKGFWASLTDSSGNALNGTANNISTIARAATGIVTVTLASPYSNLAPGSVLYLTPPLQSGTAGVTNGSYAVTYSSGDAFDQSFVGQTILLNGVAYVVDSVSGSTITLATEYAGTTGTVSYALETSTFGQPGYQTVYEVISPTQFTFQSLNSGAVSTSGGQVWTQWSQLGGTYGNAAQITNTGSDSNGAYVEWFQLGPDETLTLGSAPILTIVGQASPGTHQFAVFYENEDGAQTSPSTIVSAEAAGNGQLFLFSGLPIGPAGTTARIVGATAAGGDSFFYLSPAATAAQDGRGPSIVTGTEISDNVTISSVIDFSDAALVSGEAIDVTGNDLFAQVRLDPCCGVFEYSNRMFWWGEINNRKNMQNLGFDAGYIAPSGYTIDMTSGSSQGDVILGGFPNTGWEGATLIIGGVAMAVAPGGVSGTNITFTTIWNGSNGTYPMYALSPAGTQPPYWDASEGDGTGTLVASDRFGGFFYRMPTGGNAQIEQSIYQDQDGAPIVQPNTPYYLRLMIRIGASGIPGFLQGEFYSPSLGSTEFATFTLSQAATEWAWYTTTITTLNADAIPSDYVFKLYLSGTSSGSYVDVDEIEIIPQSQPVLDNQIRASYAENPFGFDGTTGYIAPLGVRAPFAAMGQLRGYLYMIDELDIRETQDTGSGEPSTWNLKILDQNCGACSPWSITASEDWLQWAGRHGIRFFNGSPETRKINQELARTWESIQWADPMSMWASADPVQRQTYYGIKTNSADNVADTLLVLNYRLADSTYNVPDPIHISTYSGKILATDLGRKWTKWYRSLPCGAPVTSNPYGLGAAKNFLFGGSEQQRIYYLDVLDYPPLNGDSTLAWNPTDDDWGNYASEYLTGFFYPRELEQNPLVGSYRKLFTALSFHATGFTGTYFSLITPYMDALDNPSVALPVFQLYYPDQGYDLSVGMNVVCERLALGFYSPPGSAFGLTDLAVSGRMDGVFPMRGAL